MIFVTAGTQLPFDRMLRMLDEIAPALGGEELTVQCRQSVYKPENFTTRNFIEPEDYSTIFNSARIIIAHAGIGTIVSAMQQHKPLILIPRQASLGEHRNEHQLATADHLAAERHICVVHNATDLLEAVKKAPVPDSLSEHTAKSLTAAIKKFIES